MRVVIDVDGDKQVDRTLLRLAGRVIDAKPAFERIHQDLEQAEARQFRSEGGYASGGWAPLAPATVVQRGSAHPILVRTGELRDSLTGQASGSVRVADRSFMVFGTRVPYARFHQFGTDRMPRRRPVELTEGDRRQVPRRIQQHVLDRQGLT